MNGLLCPPLWGQVRDLVFFHCGLVNYLIELQGAYFDGQVYEFVVVPAQDKILV